MTFRSRVKHFLTMNNVSGLMCVSMCVIAERSLVHFASYKMLESKHGIQSRYSSDGKLFWIQTAIAQNVYHLICIGVPCRLLSLTQSIKKSHKKQYNAIFDIFYGFSFNCYANRVLPKLHNYLITFINLEFNHFLE